MLLERQWVIPEAVSLGSCEGFRLRYNLTIILLMAAGHEMVDSQKAHNRQFGYNYCIFNMRTPVENLELRYPKTTGVEWVKYCYF